MIEASIARRYAKALVKIAHETGQMQLFLVHLEGINKMCHEHPDLLDVLSNRYMDLAARLQVVNEICQRLETPLLVKNFVKLLLQKGRIGLFDLIVKAYRHYVYQLQNKVEAVITTAKPLEESFYQEIEKILSGLVKMDVITLKKINPEVMGGIAVQIGGEIFDGTIKAHLEKMTEELKRKAQF